MNLENKALWCDLGIMPYSETSSLQEELAELRKEGRISDLILSVQHPAEVNFGTSSQDNLFSKEFLSEVSKETGGNPSEEKIKEYLSARGVGFSKSGRGGGATVLSPGQMVYYPIVNYEKITGKPLGVGEYKAKIYRIMFETLKSLGVDGIKITSDTPDAALTDRNERKDIWLHVGGKPYKLGSKGLRMSGGVAYYGFSLYIDRNGTENFWIVNPCGYSHDEVGVTSAEEVTGRKISHRKVNDNARILFMKHFRYSSIENIPKEELLNIGKEENKYA